MARMRTFIAVEVSPPVRAQAVALQRELAALSCGPLGAAERNVASVKWVEPANLHLTLAFLGEVEARDLATVSRLMAKAAAQAAPFALRLEGVGAFPTPRRPKTLWLGVTEGRDDLVRLQTALDDALVALAGYRQEGRGYTPHLTLGRVGPDADSQPLADALPRYAAHGAGQTAVSELVLMASELRRGGPEYTVLARAELTGEPPPE